MKRYIFIVAALILSACVSHAATQEAIAGKNTVTDDRTDRVIEDGDVVIGSVLGGLVGAFLDADRDDRIHASEARYRRHCDQGDIYFSKARQTSDLDERIAFMQEGVRHCSDNPAAHNDLGLGLMLWGDLTAARTHFAYALRLDPDYNPARINLSRIDYSNSSRQPNQKREQGSNNGVGGHGSGTATHRGSWDKYFQNSKKSLERLNRWNERQKKLIQQNSVHD